MTRPKLTDKKTSLPLPPGRFGFPLIGETLNFFADPYFSQKRHEKYGDVFKTNILGKPTLFVRGVEANKFVFMNEDKYFQALAPFNLAVLLGDLSVSVQTGEKHLALRKVLLPFLQGKALTPYLDSIEEIIQKYLIKWEKLETFAWYPQIGNLTLDIAAKIVLGENEISSTRMGQAIKDWKNGVFGLPLHLPWTKLGKAMNSRQKLLKYLDRIIQQRESKLDLAPTDILGNLLRVRNEVGLSLDEVKDQTLTLLFAGHDTLISSFTFFCLLMAQYPGIFEKMQSEVKAIKKQHGSCSLEGLEQLVYTEQIIKEVLRYMPIIGAGFRQIIRDCEFNGYRFSQGWNLIYEIAITHRFSGLYEEENQFIPERFKFRDKGFNFAYIPFGGGVRECLGKALALVEMKLFGVALANYEWKLVPEQDLNIVLFPNPHPRDGLLVHFRRPF